MNTKAAQRAALAAVIAQLEAPRPDVVGAVHALKALLDHLRNRPPVMRGRRTSVRVTPAVRQQIQQMHAADPMKNQSDIAKALGVNIGRISETLAGVRR